MNYKQVFVANLARNCASCFTGRQDREILESIPGKILKRNQFLRYTTSLILKSLPPQQQLKDLANLSLKEQMIFFSASEHSKSCRGHIFQNYSLLWVAEKYSQF